MNDKQIGEKALKKVLQGLKEKFKDDITSVMMYGSFARGDEQFNDIDLLVITNKSFGSRYKTTKMFAKEIFGEVYWEYGIPFSFIVYNNEQFEKLKNRLPLFREIKREGVTLYGEKLVI